MKREWRLPAGILAALLLAWIAHGPLGHGQGLTSRIDAAAQNVLDYAGVPGVTAAVQQAPLARVVTLAGPANAFQRDGMGGYPGITGRMEAIPGVAKVRWADTPASGFVLPLLAETMILALIAFFAGYAVGWFLFGRTMRRSYLGD